MGEFSIRFRFQDAVRKGAREAGIDDRRDAGLDEGVIVHRDAGFVLACTYEAESSTEFRSRAYSHPS